MIIDVSTYQGLIAWNRVRGAGVTRAMIRGPIGEHWRRLGARLFLAGQNTPKPLSFCVACFALAHAIGPDPCVRKREFMTMYTVSLSGFRSGWSIAAMQIHQCCYGVQVAWIDATSVSAKMVQFKLNGNSAFVQLIDQTMRREISPRSVDISVPVTRMGAGPNPTRPKLRPAVWYRTTLVDMRKKICELFLGACGILGAHWKLILSDVGHMLLAQRVAVCVVSPLYNQ